MRYTYVLYLLTNKLPVTMEVGVLLPQSWQARRLVVIGDESGGRHQVLRTLHGGNTPSSPATGTTLFAL